MAANTNSSFRTFTITQARIGEPLQFQPALGSKELEELVAAYVIGPASKQDKLSEVTLEFFNLAQVDIYTGLLTRHYNVVVSPNWSHLALEQSPTLSQSSGFSPPIFTPSPASSMTFADSGYGSISMTPPTRSTGAPNRVVKKTAKKVTKKTEEVRLPGFSIMTKDGVDVTSSAGRGTKTKEQREHAHLMRIMKACDECKRKKIRCDPSHRRSQTDMSRSSTSTSSCSHPKPTSSPTASIAHSTLNDSMLLFGNNAIDDFVLFPEDKISSSWNPADVGALPDLDENLDLSEFTFGGLDDFNYTADPSFDFFDQPASGFQPERSVGHGQLGHDPFTADQYGLDQWASAQGGELPVSHTRPHRSISSQDSGQLDSNFFESSIQSMGSPTSRATPSSQGLSSFAENFWPNGSASHPQIAQSTSVQLPSAEVDWNDVETSLLLSPGEDLSMNRRERRNIARTRGAAIQKLVDSIPSASDSDSPGLAEGFGSPLEYLLDQSQLGATSGGSLEYWGLEHTRAIVAEATQALKSTPGAYQPIYEELQRLRRVLDVVKSGDTERPPVLQQAMVSQLEMLTAELQILLNRIKNMLRTGRVSTARYNRLDPDFHPDFLRESSIQTRRLVSALCATINNLQTQIPGIDGSVAATNSLIISAGNRQVSLSPTSPGQHHAQADFPDSSYSSSSNSVSLQGRDINYASIQQQLGGAFNIDVVEFQHGINMLSSASEANSLGSVAIATIDKPKYRLMMKPAFEQLSRLVEVDSLEAAHANDTFSSVEYATTLACQEALFPTVPISSHSDIAALNHAVNASTARSSRVDIFSASQFNRGGQHVSIDTQNIHCQVQAYQEEINRFLQVPTSSPLIINPLLEATPTILADRDLTHRMLPSSPATMYPETVGSSRSESLQYRSGAPSPASIPGTVSDATAWCNNDRTRPALLSNTVTSYTVMLAALVLLNYLQATAFLLPLTALLLAIHHPTPAIVATITLVVVVAQAIPFSWLLSGLKYLVSVGILSVPLFRKPSNGSFGGVLSSSKTISNTLATCKDSSLLSVFRELSLRDGPREEA